MKSRMSVLSCVSVAALLMGAAEPGDGDPMPDPAPAPENNGPLECVDFVRPDIAELLETDPGITHYFECTDEVYIGTMPRIFNVEMFCGNPMWPELDSGLCDARGEIYFHSEDPPIASTLPSGVAMTVCCGPDDGIFATYLDSELRDGDCEYAPLDDTRFRAAPESGGAPRAIAVGGCTYDCTTAIAGDDDAIGLLQNQCVLDTADQWRNAVNEVEEAYAACVAKAKNATTEDEDGGALLSGMLAVCAIQRAAGMKTATAMRDRKMDYCLDNTGFRSDYLRECSYE